MNYGTCQEGLLEEIQGVDLQEVASILNEDKKVELQTLVNPLQMSDTHGCDLFITARDFIVGNQRPI